MCLGWQNCTKYHFLAFDFALRRKTMKKLLYFIMQKHYFGLKFRVFLLIVYAKFNFKKCVRLWKALVRLFTPVCATFCEIIWQY